MGIRAFLTPAEQVAEPGTPAIFALDVTGDGNDGGDLLFDVTGPAAEWALVLPARLSLSPGATARARVVVAVPRSARVPPGPALFTVRVVAGPASAEVRGIVDVRPFTDVRISLSPRVTRGRRGGEHDVRLENLGNSPVRATLAPHATDDELLVELDRSSVSLAAGEEADVTARIRPRRRRVAGRARAREFTVGVGTGEGREATADGVHWQERLRWPAPIAAVLAVAALVGLVAATRANDEPASRATVPAAAAATATVTAPPATCAADAIDASGAQVVQNFLFCPGTVTVARGTELQWVNRDAAPHTVTADSGRFDTESFGRGEVRAVRFDEAGTFAYFCRLHPFMRGTVVVR